MTFILAIQLEDSIIVAADNRSLSANHNDRSFCNQDQTTKLYPWKDGIMTGAGEQYVIAQAANFFMKGTNLDVIELAKCLKTSRQVRIKEVGEHEQIQESKLLFSHYSKDGAQLYSITPKDDGHDCITRLKPYDFIVWLVDPDCQHNAMNLHQLYRKLKNFAAFSDEQQWVDFYIAPIAEIYRLQSLHDANMSPSFDIYFQNKQRYLHRHIENNHASFHH